MSALSSQSPAPRLPLTPSELTDLTSIPFTPSLLTPTSHNALTLQCLFCHCAILLPSAALHVHRTLPLPPLMPGLAEPEDVWVVRDQMAFENVGVTRVTGEGGYKLLVCGNCDRGPIGMSFTAEPSVFYVAHGRVRYH